MEEEVKTTEEKKVVIELNAKELEVVFRGLLELPSKFSLTVIQEIQAQVYPQFKAMEPKTEEENAEGSNLENV